MVTVLVTTENTTIRVLTIVAPTGWLQCHIVNGFLGTSNIPPLRHGPGKWQSTTLASDGAGVDAVSGADLAGRNLTKTYLADVNADNLAQWKGDFGTNGDSDADNDGDSDGADFLVWQRQFGNGPPQTALVPEPPTALLLILVAAGMRARQNRTAKSQQLINA